MRLRNYPLKGPEGEPGEYPRNPRALLSIISLAFACECTLEQFPHGVRTPWLSASEERKVGEAGFEPATEYSAMGFTVLPTLPVCFRKPTKTPGIEPVVLVHRTSTRLIPCHSYQL